MYRGRFHKTISEKDININIYTKYYINNNKSIIYRCKYCYKSRIKIINNKFIRISGPEKNCYVIKRSN